MAPLLEVRDLSVHFGGLAAVKDVTFNIEQGERLAMIGPNGAGKTTLFNLLTGQLKPTGGQVLFKGKDITHASVHGRTQLGIARSFQITSLFPNETVRVNALIGLQGTRAGRFRMFGAFNKDKELRAAAMELLERIDLWDKRDEIVSSLAYGEQRKLEMALSLASDPELLLLDEPSCGLTPTESADITERIKDLGSKITVLMIAHDMDLVFGVAERIILLHFGEISCEGTCDEIRANQTVKDIYMGSHKSSHGGELRMLVIKDIHTWYGDSYVLQGVTMQVFDGSVVALLGRNGMGKTTTIRSIMGLTPPKKGQHRLQRPGAGRSCAGEDRAHGDRPGAAGSHDLPVPVGDREPHDGGTSRRATGSVDAGEGLRDLPPAQGARQEQGESPERG